jgi:cytoskeletal protein CcmA (bactofilin family)
MWNKDGQPEVPGVSPAKDSRIPGTPLNAAPVNRPGNPVVPAARNLACLGPTIVIKGEISSDEDLQIDGKVEGNISVRGNRLTVGRSANLNSEIDAREVIVYGSASGNLRARDRVEIKKDGQVIGNITTARISIEDGAYFKGRIEIERSNSSSSSSSSKESENIPVGSSAY